MKKKKALAEVGVQKCEHALEGHDHIHAANCGHKSYVHAGHICYEHDGHYHYTHDGHVHACAGPFAANVKSTIPVKNTTNRPASVHSLDAARTKKPTK